jgi:hypothetical protein
MMRRRMGSTLPAALPGLCLAALLGCGGGRNLHSIPSVTAFAPDSATVGSHIVIAGTGFKDVSSVSFYGQPAASYSVDSGNQITAVLPTTAISGYIAVVNPAGTGKSTTPFLVAPVIDSIDPTHGPAGTTITLTGSGMYGATAATLGSVPADAVTYLDPNHATVKVGSATPAGAWAVVLTASGLQATGPQFTVE